LFRCHTRFHEFRMCVSLACSFAQLLHLLEPPGSNRGSGTATQPTASSLLAATTHLRRRRLLRATPQEALAEGARPLPLAEVLEAPVARAAARAPTVRHRAALLVAGQPRALLQQLLPLLLLLLLPVLVVKQRLKTVQQLLRQAPAPAGATLRRRRRRQARQQLLLLLLRRRRDQPPTHGDAGKFFLCFTSSLTRFKTQISILFD